MAAQDDIVQMLSGKSKQGPLTLIAAATTGDTANVQAWLDKGANVNATFKNRFSILMLAAQGGHTSTVQLLLDRGAEVNAKNKEGKTALMLAESAGQTEVLQLLTTAGAR